LYANPAWTPDGSRIVATRAAARDLKEGISSGFFPTLGGQFIWVSSNGGPVNVIAPSGSRDVAHFRADEPDRIYAYSPAEGLVSFRWDGTDVKTHLRVMGTPSGGGTPHPEEWQVLPRRVFPYEAPQITLENDGMEPTVAAPPAGLVMVAPR